MADIITDRVCGEAEPGAVLFLIGMRFNRPWKIWKWLPVFLAMPRMLAELGKNPAIGLLNAKSYLSPPNVMVVQYWRSVEDLLAYAHDANRAHLPAWQAFNRAIGNNGDVGIWHETHVISPGQAESIYVNMPRFGLGFSGALNPATGRFASAGKRLADARRP